jgi:phosphate starvation-inducible membrane PsiE
MSIIIIFIVISFMQGISTYIPETIHVPREYNVSADATAPKQMETIPTPHSNQFQLFHDSER